MVGTATGPVKGGPALSPCPTISVEVSRATFAPGTAGAVVLTRADQFPDALAGTPLAVALKAPLLLTGSDALDPRTEAELLPGRPRGRDRGGRAGRRGAAVRRPDAPGGDPCLPRRSGRRHPLRGGRARGGRRARCHAAGGCHARGDRTRRRGALLPRAPRGRCRDRRRLPRRPGGRRPRGAAGRAGAAGAARRAPGRGRRVPAGGRRGSHGRLPLRWCARAGPVRGAVRPRRARRPPPTAQP